MDKYKEDVKKAKTRSMIFTILLVIGLPLTIAGAVLLGSVGGAGFIVMLTLGIVCLVLGFYGTPLAWVKYGDYAFCSRVLIAINEEHFYSVDEMATYLRRPKRVISDAIEKCVDRKYLTGYKFDGSTLTLNENTPLRPEVHSVQCEYCGALVNFEGKVSTCPYCNAIVKYYSEE